MPAGFNNARSQGLRAFLLSPGVIADPYRGPRPWPALSSFLGTSGWKALVRMISRPVHDVLTLGQCQQIKGFTRDNFKAEAGQLYRQISQLIAENHVTSLRHLVTEKALTDIKREAKTREKAGWGKIVWEIRDLEKPVTLQGRMIFPNPQDKQMAFAQMTVGFRSHQRYAAYDAKGRLVAGDPSGFLPVEDVWVLEHAFKLPNARWRLAARLPAAAPGRRRRGTRTTPRWSAGGCDDGARASEATRRTGGDCFYSETNPKIFYFCDATRPDDDEGLIFRASSTSYFSCLDSRLRWNRDIK